MLIDLLPAVPLPLDCPQHEIHIWAPGSRAEGRQGRGLSDSLQSRPRNYVISYPATALVWADNTPNIALHTDYASADKIIAGIPIK